MKSMETGRQDGGSDKNHAPFSVGETGNISRKFLTIILKIFDKNFERLHFLMQFQADILNAEIIRPKCIETTALGAAYLAGLAVGYWKDKEEIKKNWQIAQAFEAHMDEEIRKQLVAGWKRAVRCALSWASEEE